MLMQKILIIISSLLLYSSCPFECSSPSYWFTCNSAFSNFMQKSVTSQNLHIYITDMDCAEDTNLDIFAVMFRCWQLKF